MPNDDRNLPTTDSPAPVPFDDTSDDQPNTAPEVEVEVDVTTHDRD